MPTSLKTAARITANSLPVYRVFAGYNTARHLKTDKKNPERRDWDFAGRVLFDASTDMVDGRLARYAGKTVLGGYLDQISDKAWFLQIARQLADNGEIPKEYIKVITARDIGLTIVRPIAQHFGLNSDAQVSGKAKMLAQVTATVAACSPVASERPDMIEILYGVAAGAAVVSGVDTLMGYVDDLDKRYPSSSAAQLIVASTTWLTETV